MQAKTGDWLVIKGPSTEQGLITEVRSSDGPPPYVVRWLETGRVSRAAAVQAAITHHTGGA